MVAAIVVGLLVLLLAPMGVHDLRQQRRGRRVMAGSQDVDRYGTSRPDSVIGFPGFGGGGEGGFGGG